MGEPLSDFAWRGAISRRSFFVAVGGAAATVSASCKSGAGDGPSVPEGEEHLSARATPPSGSVSAGLQPLGLGSETNPRDGRLFVPAGYNPTEPLPLLVLLHGAGGSSANWFGSYGARADAAQYILLAPDSRFSTWDIGLGAPFSIDVPFIDQALRTTFRKCAVDPRRIAVAGFSDGASYALSLGLANGDLFDRAVAFSPGFFVDSTRRGKPKLFVSHGTADRVLPIDQASGTLVPKFRKEGYAVEYVQFSGGHEVTPSISDQAFAWLKLAWG